MHYVATMRTTIDLPEDIHRRLRSVARERRQSLSLTVTTILREALEPGAEPGMRIDPGTGWPVVATAHVVTSDDVRSLEDDL